MFGIGGTELLIIIIFVLLIFGPDKLPQFGRTIGQMMREFKRAQETMEAVIKAEVYAERKTTDSGADVEAEEEFEEEEDEGEGEGEEEEDAGTPLKKPKTSGTAKSSGAPKASGVAKSTAIAGDADIDTEPETPEAAGGWTPGKAAPEADEEVAVANDQEATGDEPEDEREEVEEAL